MTPEARPWAGGWRHEREGVEDRSCFRVSTLSLSPNTLAVNKLQAISTSDGLSFEERVIAQEVIERVYYNHRIWPKENPQPKPPFEEMVPKGVIEAKVTEYLKKCNALDKFWQRPITAEQLQAEMDRMCKGTKDPTMLKELFAALNSDPYLIAECLARPILADRLIHNWYAYDTRFHGDLKAEAQALRDQLTPANFPYLDATHYRPIKIELADVSSFRDEMASDPMTMRLGADSFKRTVEEYPGPRAISQVEETAEAFVIRWTEDKTEGTLQGGVIAFEKTHFTAWYENEAKTLSKHIPATEGSYVLSLILPSPLADPTSPDSWKALYCVPQARQQHTTVWTGTEMIIWGGSVSIYPKTGTGGRYAPSTDTWTATSTGTNCPTGRQYHTAVWTGTQMIVWGGYASGSLYFGGGGCYNPSSDSWTFPSGVNGPTARYWHTAVWTGTAMIIWGGYDGVNSFNTGGRYAPSSDSWTATFAGGPSERAGHTAVWTGTEMIVWGAGDLLFNTGGRYTPSTDTWTATSTGANCPSGRQYPTAVWTGTEMVIWGGG